ncbi:hypothetical protein CBM2586_A100239 [Cupriavidus phytorum]|uniref:Uncharacterized protein n=1 Tax=Cupriavidus taiwanensis TaxID=164546 RepID=A0A375BZJ9_9BURK|nr:hypothetical protein CBM2586_A100239 [Cupriavidus taiwanensis]
MRGGVVLRLGDRHQPAQPQIGQGGDRMRQRGHLGRGDAALAGFAADIDLDADLQRRHAGRALRRQPLGDPEPVDGVDPVEMFRHRPRLVALQRADEMPLQAVAQVGQRGDLVDAFLDVVLAELALSGGVCGPYAVGGNGLGNGQQGDVRGLPAGLLCCRRNALAHGLQVGGNHRHNPANIYKRYVKYR